MVALVVWAIPRSASAASISLVCGACVPPPAGHGPDEAKATVEILEYISPDPVSKTSYTDYPWTLPYSQVRSVLSKSGAGLAQSTYSFSTEGFNIAFEHSSASVWTAIVRSYGNLAFYAHEDIPYSAEGIYSADAERGSVLVLRASLYDRTVGSYLFDSYQVSTVTPYESFVLGQSGGDNQNTSTGSLSGTLISGHEYVFYYQADVSAAASPTPPFSYALELLLSVDRALADLTTDAWRSAGRAGDGGADSVTESAAIRAALDELDEPAGGGEGRRRGAPRPRSPAR